MSSRLIVVGSSATATADQVFEDLQAALEGGSLGGDVAVLNATAGQNLADIVKNPSASVTTAVISLRSAQNDALVVRGLSAVPAPSFDVLGWNLDVAASANLTVIYALDGSGMNADLLAQEINTFTARAKEHHATVAAVVLAGARGSDVTGVSVPVLHSPVTEPDLAVIAEAQISALTPLAFQDDLMKRAGASPQRIVLPEPEDDRILYATDALLKQQVADIILIGDEDAVRRRALELGLDIAAARVVPTSDPTLAEKYAEELARLRAAKGMTVEDARKVVADTTYFATMMVQMGDADGMVSGATHTTADTIRPAFQIIKTAPGTKLVSSSFLMLLEDQAMVFGDCAVVISPTAEQMAQIAISSARTAQAFGIDPRVAMLSYSTLGSGSGASPDLVTEATELARAEAPDLAIEGPLQFDAAIDATTGKQKAPQSSVAGRANVLIFPDLNAGNIAYKAVQRTAGAVAVGPILQGLRKPINDLSRGAKVEDIINTVAITAVQAQAEGSK
ncbi:phosphate acetyltransferase [Actinomyces minihominis]|uniref:phosphate acetyltransferase n=1 Tax=Actinomyces minihominis TaxID=2002838 RepID=UPI000C078371|nr:phosphate acetyltransferase [Actinomyces minihominis]